MTLYDGQRKLETNDLHSNNWILKKLKDTEDKLFSTQELLRQTHKTKTLDTIILSDNGISSSRDIDNIINEINNGELIDN